MQRVQDLLMKLPAKCRAGQARSISQAPYPGRDDAEGARGAAAQRRGRHQACRRPPAPGDRPRQGDRPLSVIRSRRSRRPTSTRASHAPWPAAWKSPSELAKKDKIAFDAKMKTRASAPRSEKKRLRILEADKRQARADEGHDGQGPVRLSKGGLPRPKPSPCGHQDNRSQRGRPRHPRLQGQSRAALEGSRWRTSDSRKTM